MCSQVSFLSYSKTGEQKAEGEQEMEVGGEKGDRTELSLLGLQSAHDSSPSLAAMTLVLS